MMIHYSKALSDTARIHGSIFTFVTKYSLNYVDTMNLANLPIVSYNKAATNDEGNPLNALFMLECFIFPKKSKLGCEFVFKVWIFVFFRAIALELYCVCSLNALVHRIN